MVYKVKKDSPNGFAEVLENFSGTTARQLTQIPRSGIPITKKESATVNASAIAQQVPEEKPEVTVRQSNMSTAAKWGWGIGIAGVAVALYFGVRHFKKAHSTAS